MWELDYRESWVPKNWCFWTVVLEKTLESPLDCKEIQPVHPKGDQSWEFIEWLMLKPKLQTLATWHEELTPWKRPWCWERLKAGGEWDDRAWDGWMASNNLWTWVWVNSRNWWRTGRSGVLKSMGLQRVWHDWATELNWTEWFVYFIYLLKEPAFSFLDFCYHLLFSFLFISVLIFMTSFLLLPLGFFISSFSSCFWCKARILILFFSCFLS